MMYQTGTKNSGICPSLVQIGCRNFGKKGSKTAEISAVLDVSNQTGNGQKNPNSVSNETV